MELSKIYIVVCRLQSLTDSNAWRLIRLLQRRV